MKVKLLFLTCILFLNIVFCQNKPLDTKSEQFKEVERLIYKGVTFEREQNYIMAEKNYEEAIAISESDSCKNCHDLISISKGMLGRLFRTTGEYKKALKLSLEAFENAKKQLGEKHPFYAASLSNLAGLHQIMGNYKKAIAVYLEALEVVAMINGKDHVTYSSLLTDLSRSYKYLGRYKDALVLSLKAHQNIKEKLGTNNRFYRISLSNLASLYYMMGQYKKALFLYKENLENTKRNLGESSPEYGTGLHNLAQLYKSIGEYKKALDFFLSSLKNTEKSLGKHHPEYGFTLKSIGDLYQDMGQYGKALSLYLKAINIIEETLGKQHIEYGLCLISLADLYHKTGQYKKSLLSYLKAKENIKNVNEDHPFHTAISNNLATLFLSMEQPEKALKLYQEVLEKTKQKLGSDHPDFGTALSNTGLSLNYLSQPEKAIPLLFKALENIEKNFSIQHVEYGACLNNLAMSYDSMNDYDKAISLYNKAIKNIEKNFGEKHAEYGTRIINLALLNLKIKQFDISLSLFEKSNDNRISQIQQNFLYLTSEEKENFINNIIRSDLNYHNNFNYRTNNTYPNARYIAMNNVLTFKGLLLNSIKNILSDLRTLRQDTLDKKVELFRLKKAQVTRQLQLPLNQRKNNLNQVRNELNRLERDLVAIYSRHFGKDINYIKNFKKTLLKKNELAIEFTHFKLFNKKWADSIMYVAHLYKKEWETPKVVNLFEEKQLKKYLTSSTSPNRLYTSRGGKLVDKKGILADSIYNLVWKPLEPYVQNSSAIYYSPDGLLHKIPFAVLPNEENKLLGERYNLNQMGNTADIRKNNKLSNLNDVLLIGGVDYSYTISDSKKDTVALENSFNILQSDQLLGDDNNKKGSSGGESWEYLRGTAYEINAIKKLLPNSTILTQKEATETAFKNLSGNSPSVLHIATHGYFFPDLDKKKEDFRLGNEPYIHSENPLLRSGLILANANYAWKHGSNPYEEDDGILTALEISNLNLRNTDIVILSACETGLGDIPSSEGVYGLQRAFKMAGVETIIMTLWEVPDTETAEFMNLFYTQWKASNDPKKAFKETQKIMMNRYRNDPVKWAGFVYFE